MVNRREFLEEDQQKFAEEFTQILKDLAPHVKSLQHSITPDTIEPVLRFIHSIRGGARALHLDKLFTFADRLESLLAGIKYKRLEPTEAALYVINKSYQALIDYLPYLKIDQSIAFADDDLINKIEQLLKK